MRTILTSLTVLILFNNSLAQVSSSEPIQLNKNILVHSAGLPEEFLLFSPDSATQILFNPARAYNYSTNFVYVNYLSDYIYSYPYRLEGNIIIPISIEPFQNGFGTQRTTLAKGNAYDFPSLYEESYSSSKNPTFSAAALFNAGDAKWLFTLSNGVNMNRGENSTNFTEERIYDPVNNFGTDNLSDDNNYNSDEIMTTFKIARIWQSGLTSFSLGAFGIIYNDDEQGEENFMSTSYDFFNSTTDSVKHRSYSSNIETETGELNNSRYVVGFEFAVNDAGWDYIGSLSYQKANNSGNVVGDLNRVNYDSSYYSIPWYVYNIEENRKTNKNLDNEPYFLNFNNYFQHSVDWITHDDNLFLTLNSFYSSGEISFQGDYNHTYTSYYNGELSTGDTTSVKHANTFDANSWGITFSSGYALSATLSDLFVLTGISLAGSFNHLESASINLSSLSSGYFAENVIKNTFAGFTLPLYLNYTIEQWISLYGGINYSYFYRRLNLSSNTSASDYISNGEELKATGNRESTYSNWNSSKLIYLGCELRHTSGFKVQFFFNEDFSNIRDFNVSVGYHF